MQNIPNDDFILTLLNMLITHILFSETLTTKFPSTISAWTLNTNGASVCDLVYGRFLLITTYQILMSDHPYAIRQEAK